MNLSTEKLPEGVLILRSVVGAEDYAAEVEKSLRDLRKKANIPGFRAGMVPAGVVNKMYGKGVRAEQAYRKANGAVLAHLEGEKIEIIGDVMPSELQAELDFSDGVAEHEFVFEVGLAPTVEVSVEGEKLTRYKIKPSKEMREAYDKGMAEGVPDDKERAAKVDEALEADLGRESDFLLTLQIKNLLLKKAGLQLPEEFLKRWLFAVNEGKFSMEEIEKDFAGFVRMMAWGLVMKYFEDKLGLEITKEDMEAEARSIAAMQFAQYGLKDVPEETLNGFALNILSNREQAQQIFERLRESRVVDALKATMKISEKSVSLDEFQKLAQAAND